MWISPLLQRALKRVTIPKPVAGLSRVGRVLDRYGEFASRKEFLRVLLGAVSSEKLTIQLSEKLQNELPDLLGLSKEALEELLLFWQELERKTANNDFAKLGKSKVFWDLAKLTQGPERGALEIESMKGFIAVFNRQPSLVTRYSFVAGLAASVGGEQLLDYQLLALQSSLRDSLPDEERVSELYSELLEEHAMDEAALEKIYSVGSQIQEAIRSGVLPRVFVRRGSSRHKISP